MSNIVDGLFVLPTVKQISRWKGDPSPATVIARIASSRDIARPNLSHNTINKYFGNESGSSAKYISEILMFGNRVAGCFDESDTNDVKKTPTLNSSEASVLLASLLKVELLEMGSKNQVFPPKPSWSYAALLYEMFYEEFSYVNSSSPLPSNSSHFLRLNCTAGLHSSGKSRLLFAIDTYLYITACELACFCAFMIASRYSQAKNILLELYRPPYTRGIFQERYFLCLRGMTKGKKWNSLKIYDEPTCKNDEGESSNRRQINSWKSVSDENMSYESLQKLLNHSILEEDRRLNDEKVFWKCYRSMLFIRNMIDDLESEGDIEQVNSALSNYCQYFEFFLKEIEKSPRSQGKN